ncbi:MAG: mycofactocin system glycosyltransferase [Alphaproteobacteria bacterium]|jgi:mycofactocin system glycosyltransferase|nr:mycofactocin system glycosyltransferase [Alphaproteobacteria bacterium]
MTAVATLDRCVADRATPGERYRLAAGLEIVRQESGGLLFSARPLVALRLNPIGLALVSALSTDDGRSAADIARAVPDLSPVDAAAFLDGLAGRRLVERAPPAPAAWPSVSVIVAAHGRPAGTRDCILSLLGLDYPGEVEIIVVDDASEPPLASALAGLPVRLMRLDRNVGQSAARNLAAAEATGALLAFTDNDCLAGPAWLRDLVPWFDDPETAAVGGRVAAPPPDGAVARFEAVRSPLDMGATGSTVGPREAVAYLPTCNLLVRRDALLAGGGFARDMRVGEDVDFVWRLLQAGGRARYVPAGAITHDHRVRLGALLARRADYGSSEAALQERHPEAGRIQYLPRAGLAGLIALAVVPVFWPAALALIALALTLVGAELAGKARRLRGLGLSVPLRPLAAAMLRGHGAGLYHLGRDVTRYYGVPLLLLGLVWLPLLPVVGLLMLVPPVADHRRLRPGVSLPAFAGLFWLEMAAYQWGVWRGCLAWRRWRPLLPALRWRP